MQIKSRKRNYKNLFERDEGEEELRREAQREYKQALEQQMLEHRQRRQREQEMIKLEDQRFEKELEEFNNRSLALKLRRGSLKTSKKSK
jgi:hypothetical protein